MLYFKSSGLLVDMVVAREGDWYGVVYDVKKEQIES